MKRANGLFERLVDADQLAAAARRTLRGKQRRPDVAWVMFRREQVLARIESELRSGSWRPGPIELLFLRDPKPRAIARSSVEDRIVHGALSLQLEAVILRSAVDGDLACRAGGGTHRAWLRLLEGMRRHRFALHLDVRSFFPSIEPTRVMRQLHERVADRRFLAVIERVLDHGRGLYDTPVARRHARMDSDWPPPGRGLPMGASTSQLLASHLYLQRLDHYLKRTLKVPLYVRYVDDFFLFGRRRADLREWREAVGAYLQEELDLRLKHPRAPIISCAGHLDGLGARIRRTGIEVPPKAWRRMRGRVGRYVRRSGRAMSLGELERSLAGQAGTLFFG